MQHDQTYPTTPRRLTPEPALSAETSTHQLVQACAGGHHFFWLLNPTLAPRVPVHQAPHGDSAHDFLVQ
jgi:hypothetical protein